MKMFRSLILFALLLLSIHALPTHAEAGVCQSKSAIVFSNGMYNDKKAADDSLVKLEITIRGYFQASQYLSEFEFYLAYADNGGAAGLGSLSGLAQLHEAFVQKQAATYAMFWRWAGGLPGAPAWFSTLMQDIAVATNATAYVNDPDLQKQLSGDPANLQQQPGYKALLNKGMRVVIVAHSQGNFYANRAYDALAAQKPEWGNSVGIVAVASPDIRVASINGLHVTAIEDVVIAALWPNTLTANATNTTTGGNADTWGHDFVGSYLNGNSTRPLIMNYILASRQQLQPSPFNMEPQVIMSGMGVAAAPDGSIYISLSAGSSCTPVRGGGTVCVLIPGGGVKKLVYKTDGPSTITSVPGVPQVEHVGPDGSLYYGDSGMNGFSYATNIFRVSPQGQTGVVYSAGSFPNPYRLYPYIYDFDVASDGGVYIAEDAFIYRVGPAGAISHVAGRSLGLGRGAPPTGVSALDWGINTASNLKAGFNGNFFFAIGVRDIQSGGDTIIHVDLTGNVWMLPSGWYPPWPPQISHSVDEGYDICPNGDILNAIGGSLLRYSNSGITSQIATGVNANSVFEWSGKDDTVYYADPLSGTVNKLVPSPN